MVRLKADDINGKGVVPLSRQLWIALTALILVAFLGTYVISMVSARNYLEEQLRLKNQDNAAALALTLSQLEKDAGTLELFVAAQFDSGHYHRIEIHDANGKLLVQRTNPEIPFPGPAWIPRQFPFHVNPGRAEIQAGWTLFGAIEVESDSSFAYLALWQETCRLTAWFGAGLLLCGLIGTWLLHRIVRPLESVVGQAEAMGARRFIQIELPRTLEFRRVVLAMNTLARRVKEMLADEAQRLEALKRESHHDPLTGILLRQPFLQQLESLLDHEDESAMGSLVFGRISGLERMNLELGRDIVDQLLKRVGEKLQDMTGAQENLTAGRLGGADFALLVAGEDNALIYARTFAEQLHLAADEANLDGERFLPVGATTFSPGEDLSKILSRADGALISAQRNGGLAVQVADPRDSLHALTDLKSWRAALEDAFLRGSVKLARYPVMDSENQLVHEECPVRVLVREEWQTAALVMPWVARLGLLPRLDGMVIARAIELLAEGAAGIGIHVSAEALCDTNFRDQLSAVLRDAGARETSRLWLEIPEAGAFRHLDQFRSFCTELKPFGCRIGLEHVGSHLGRFGQLHDLGIDFIKIDSALVRNIEGEPGNQALVRGLCTIAHSIGLKVIAEGVKSEQERQLLPLLGFDAMTGPGIS